MITARIEADATRAGVTRLGRSVLLVAAVSIAAGTGAARAFAQAQGAATAEPPKVKVERGAGGRKVYRITEEIRIEGKIQKPEAFYVLQKSSINYEWTKLKKDFVPKILDSVANAPF